MKTPNNYHNYLESRMSHHKRISECHYYPHEEVSESRWSRAVHQCTVSRVFQKFVLSATGSFRKLFVLSTSLKPILIEIENAKALNKTRQISEGFSKTYLFRVNYGKSKYKNLKRPKRKYKDSTDLKSYSVKNIQYSLDCHNKYTLML